MQRLFKIAPQYEQIRTLIGDGLHSSQSIALIPQHIFVEKYANKLEGSKEALLVYNRAQNIHTMALTLYAKHSSAFNSVMPYVISGDLSGRASRLLTATDSSVSDPTWRKLFGSLDFCDCEHCRSVYSPAAYLVDVLKFLDEGPKNQATPAKTPLDILYSRRPDIAHIELTCENTNTSLPYVDLVNEVLENAIASIFQPFIIFPILNITGPSTLPETDLDNSVLSEQIKYAFEESPNHIVFSPEAVITVAIKGSLWHIRDHGELYTVIKEKDSGSIRVNSVTLQTSGTTEELEANPEHTNRNAYDDVLTNAVYPWNLPFNLWIEEARAYLGHLGIQRHELREIFFKGVPSTHIVADKDIAREYIGLTKKEAEIISGIASEPIWQLWGLLQIGNDIPDPSDGTMSNAVGDWNIVLQRVSIFLLKSGLSYKELLELLSTYFINPLQNTGTRTFSIVALDKDEMGNKIDPATCDLSKLEIRAQAVSEADMQALLKAAWKKIHRFIRLWRKLGWTMRDLDKAITALQPKNTPIGDLDLTDEFITHLSHIKRLYVDLNVPIVNMLGWWANLDTANYIDYIAKDNQLEVKSLYDHLFLNKTVFNPINEIFELNSARTDLRHHTIVLLLLQVPRSVQMFLLL